MNLYLSSTGIPTQGDLAALLGKPLNKTSVALIPNAKDYYSNRAWKFAINSRIKYMEGFGFNIEVVDLRDYNNKSALSDKLLNHDLIWAMGGNTFMLRYEMKRSGFDQIIKDLLARGVVYGGDSAGALVVGLSIDGIESADEPEFAEEVVRSGMGVVPFNILPHVDDPEFSAIVPIFKQLHPHEEIIELKDSQAVIFKDGDHRIVTGQVPPQF